MVHTVREKGNTKFTDKNRVQQLAFQTAVDTWLVLKLRVNKTQLLQVYSGQEISSSGENPAQCLLFFRVQFTFWNTKPSSHSSTNYICSGPHSNHITKAKRGQQEEHRMLHSNQGIFSSLLWSQASWVGFPGGSAGKESGCNAGDSRSAKQKGTEARWLLYPLHSLPRKKINISFSFFEGVTRLIPPTPAPVTCII